MSLNKKENFLTCRIQSICTDVPLVYDVYLQVSSDLVLFRKIGDVITSARMTSLLEHGLKDMYVPREQEGIYRESMRKGIQNEDLKVEVRGRMIKETAFNHISELFTKPDVKELALDSTGLVEDMVNFMGDDIEAARKLMALSSHDYYTYNHSVNVSVYCIAICRRTIGSDKMLLMAAGLGGLLHDLGKRKIGHEIINKPGKLSQNEWVEMKKHPTFGIELLRDVKNVSEDVKRVVYEHHEHLDGTGYPRGLTDIHISQLSRVCAIADVFDALTTKRSYKEAVSGHEALEIMANMKEGKFDPQLFKAMEKLKFKKSALEIESGADPCDESFASGIKKAS